LVDELEKAQPKLKCIEMETFHLFDMAECSVTPIKSAAAMIVLAQRHSDEFIKMELKHQRETQVGKAALDSLTTIPLSSTMSDDQCVWNKQKIQPQWEDL